MAIPSDPIKVNNLLNKGQIQGHSGLGGFAFSVNMAVPYIATAIHAGNRVQKELLPLMELGPEERYLEEDPETDTMIQDAESAVWGLNSRSEYDLNRPLEEALPLTPEQFWGKRVYRKSPDHEMIRAIKARHQQFYEFISNWVQAAIHRFGACLVYDIHSYNITRQQQKGHASPPVFNLGTATIDRKRWEISVEDWMHRLKGISIPGVKTTVAENQVFEGKGELCTRLTRWDPNILVLPTEISKVYMDEEKGTVHRDKVKALRYALGRAMVEHGRAFLALYAISD